MSALFDAPRAGDFDGLYRDHAPSVYRYTYAALGNHADAEDVTQQTFLNAYRALAAGTKPRKSENWLLSIAHNEVRRHLRSRQRKPRQVPLDEEVAQPAGERGDPSLADVLRALQHLPPTQRSALVMREFEGRSYAEIAQVMGLSQSALESTIFRARRGLAEHLEDSLTCGEAEQALLSRLDRRLPGRVGRRLKAHLQDCRACVRFEHVHRKQRGLLKGLSVLPIPASLFLSRTKEAAAAALGPTATAAGGSAVVGSGTAVGAGSAGIAAGFVAKAAAVTVAVTVAGGVGYGGASGSDALAEVKRKSARVADVAPRRDGQLQTRILRRSNAGHRSPGAGRSTLGSPARKRDKAESRAKLSAANADPFWTAPTAGQRPGRTRAKTSPSHKPHPVTPAAMERKPESPRPRPAGNQVVTKARTARPRHIRRSESGQKPNLPRRAKPTPLETGAQPEAKGPAGNSEPKGSSPSGQADPNGAEGSPSASAELGAHR
jgi:RNA polymerase sigma factor (sigma-70 family)